MDRDGDSGMIQATEACPKSMSYGPCGGVTHDGHCEVAPTRCVFLDAETVRWSGIRADSLAEPRVSATELPPVAPSAGAERMRALIAQRPIVVADFPAKPLDAASIAACGEILNGSVDAVLHGDAGQMRVQFPPAYRARLVQEAGLTPWAGVNTRDRNRVALEGEVAALAHAGVAGVHCVTGDHTLTGSRPDARPVFDLDSTELAALARTAGHLVSVAESPLAPPRERRASRLLEKQHAGAEICFVNHAGGAEPVAAFIADARAQGVTLGFIPCLPIILDSDSAALIRSFTELPLPPGYLEGILGASDTVEAGIAAAIALGHEFLAIDGVVGVDLSGGVDGRDELGYARAVATIAAALGGGGSTE